MNDGEFISKNPSVSLFDHNLGMAHCLKSVQIRSFFWRFGPNTGKYGPEKTQYLDASRSGME